MQQPGTGDVLGIHIGGGQSAARRAGPVVGDLDRPAAGAVPHDQAGGRAGVGDGPAQVQAVAAQFTEDDPAERIGADSPEPADMVPEPGEADGDIRFRPGDLAAKARRLLQRDAGLGQEQHHGFAEGHHLGRGHHRRQRVYSPRTTSRSPTSTFAPVATSNSATIPSLGLEMVDSIFIASMTTSP